MLSTATKKFRIIFVDEIVIETSKHFSQKKNQKSKFFFFFFQKITFFRHSVTSD